VSRIYAGTVGPRYQRKLKDFDSIWVFTVVLCEEDSSAFSAGTDNLFQPRQLAVRMEGIERSPILRMNRHTSTAEPLRGRSKTPPASPLGITPKNPSAKLLTHETTNPAFQGLSLRQRPMAKNFSPHSKSQFPGRPFSQMSIPQPLFLPGDHHTLTTTSSILSVATSCFFQVLRKSPFLPCRNLRAPSITHFSSPSLSPPSLEPLFPSESPVTEIFFDSSSSSSFANFSIPLN